MSLSGAKNISSNKVTCFFQAGEPIVRQGDVADTCFFLVKGTAKVWIKQQSTDESLFLGQLKSGDSIGEMGLILDQTRSATVMATDIALALRIRKKDFETLCETKPGFHWESRRHSPCGYPRWMKHYQPLQQMNNTHPIRMPSQLLPVHFIKKHSVIPLSMNGSRLTVGMVELKNQTTKWVVSKLMLPSIDVET